MVKKMALHLVIILTVFAGSAYADREATYEFATGQVHIPIVDVGGDRYQVWMQQTDGLNFLVTGAAQLEIFDTLELYNLAVGNAWTYRAYEVDDYGTDLKDRSTTVSVTGTAKLNGLNCYTLHETNIAEKEKTTHICYDSNYIYKKYNDEGSLLRVHDRYVHIGKESAWSYPTLGKLAVSSSVTIGLVSTPIYQGPAVAIDNVFFDSDTNYGWSERIYLVEGIGLVRATNDDDDGNWLHHNRRLVATNALN